MMGPGDDMLDAKGERVFFSRDALMHNTKSMSLINTFVMLIGGCCAGILGCTGLRGALLYVLLYGTLQVVVLATMGFDSMKYTLQPPLKFIAGNAGENALSFILFWTLVYALVYIY